MYVDSNQHAAHPDLSPKNSIITKLPVDYVVKDIRIEYKTSSDFFRSITDGRLWKQAEVADIFLIAWSSDEFIKHIPYRYAFSSVLGALSALLLSFQKSVIFLPKEWSKEFLESLARKEEKPGKIPSFKRKSKSLSESARNMLMEIPGISVRRVDVITEEFSNIREIVTADTSRIEKLSLPKKVKENLKNIWEVSLK